jgi:Fe-S-cluster-containing hydrogenase component 2
MSGGRREVRERQVLVVQSAKCQGCQACMVACSLVHEGQVMPSLSRIQVVLDPFEGNHLIRYCHQCRRAPCAARCPRGAIQLNEDGSALLSGSFWAVDPMRCDGCGACVEVCPFQAMLRSTLSDKAIKCDLCQGQPACVAICPSEALSMASRGRTQQRSPSVETASLGDKGGDLPPSAITSALLSRSSIRRREGDEV